MYKVVITCAVTGAETTRSDNPHLPLAPQEIADAAAEAHAAGAAILHLHVRDDQGRPTQDVEVFRKTIELIRRTSDIVIEVTTGGAVGMTLQERMAPLALAPEMASLDCGTMNFADEYILNTLPMMRTCAGEMNRLGVRPTLECFDLSHVDAAAMLIKEGLVAPPFHYGIVLNVPGGVRYDGDTLNFFVRRLPPASYWTAIGIGGRGSLAAVYGAIAAGGFIRVGFEDNVFYGKGVLAESNAQLVERAVRIAKEYGCEIATPSYVRKLFGLRS
jgi:3-keto-5-aminohexanoate cleavage enzyme